MVAISKNPPTVPEPSPEEIRQTLDRILTSTQFAHAPKKQRFLQLICEAYLNGRAGELNEYMIGYEVFDRSEAYNPALDPIVRVGAHELRRKLEVYYQREGKNDDIKLDIPVGSYIPTFRRRGPAQTSETESARARSAFPNKISFVNAILIACLCLLLLAVALLAGWNRQLRRQLVADVEQAKEIPAVYKTVWQPFFRDENPTLLVLSNPPVYRFWNPVDPDTLSGRSVELTDAQSAALQQALGQERFITKGHSIRRVVLSSDEYTGLGEAIGLHLVTSLLNKISRTALVKQSRTVSVEDLKNRDVILLGSVWVNEWSGKSHVEEDFTIGPSATIVNHNPQPGEQLEYRAKLDGSAGSMTEDYALVTVKPNISERNTVIVLAGTHSEGTEAAAEYVTNEDYLQSLDQRLSEMGKTGMRHFQLLLKVAVDNGIPTTISLIAIHELHRS
jgi:hypothetical protein